MTDSKFTLLSVQVARAQPLQVAPHQSVLSGIGKRPVDGPVAVRALGLDGDEQADLNVHGGLSKAVYAYPAEHYAFWRRHRAERGHSPEGLQYGAFGENLTIAGLLEDDVYVGDELHFPDCALRVTEPRRPCFKLAAVMNDKSVARTMLRERLCGFYLAVDRPGTIAAGQAFELRPGSRQTPLLTLLPRPRD